jgi:Ca-activated chloride channel homolog
MKKFTALVLFCSFTLAMAQTASPQSRPRRVGPTPPPQQEPQARSTQPTPEADSTEPVRPTRAPVLGGATRDSNEQKPEAKQKDAGPEEVGEGDVVKVDTTLVSIPVSVMDRDGKYIPDLTKDDFHVWEDGVEQRVAYFASTEKPFTVALLIDTSGSTRFRLDEIQNAAITFVEQLRPDDRVMVVSFSDKIRVLAQPTSDRNTLRNAIRQTEAGDGTRLYDAVDQVENQYFNRIEGRKAMVLFTDGVDTTSKHASYESTLRDAEELDALIYPVEYDTASDVGIGGGWPSGGGRGGRRGGGYPGGSGGGYPSGNGGGGILDVLGAILGGGSSSNRGGYPGGNYPNGGGYPGGNYPNGRNGRRGGSWPGGGSGNSREEYELGDRYLHDLARVSGARLYNAEQQNLDYAFRSVAEELRRQYSIGYYPKNAPRAGERRNVKVRVDRPELVVRTRDSYVFQPGANASAQTNTQQKPPVLKKDLTGTF